MWESTENKYCVQAAERIQTAGRPALDLDKLQRNLRKKVRARQFDLQHQASGRSAGNLARLAKALRRKERPTEGLFLY